MDKPNQNVLTQKLLEYVSTDLEEPIKKKIMEIFNIFCFDSPECFVDVYETFEDSAKSIFWIIDNSLYFLNSLKKNELKHIDSYDFLINNKATKRAVFLKVLEQYSSRFCWKIVQYGYTDRYIKKMCHFRITLLTEDGVVIIMNLNTDKKFHEISVFNFETEVSPSIGNLMRIQYSSSQLAFPKIERQHGFFLPNHLFQFLCFEKNHKLTPPPEEDQTNEMKEEENKTCWQTWCDWWIKAMTCPMATFPTTDN